MERFPKDFADFLNSKGHRILERGFSKSREVFHGHETPLALLNGVVESKRAIAGCRLLDKNMYEHVRRVEHPIPPETITEMRRDYTEKLPKTMRFKTSYFSSRSSLSYKAASRTGLIDMMKSESLASFAEAVTGLTLERDRGLQLILYEPGDYAGPHNDHHPENNALRHGFVDMHISLTNSGVANQYLVCEEGGHLSKMYSVSNNGTIALYRLPFWHYTTPLCAKRFKSNTARRWLLLASFHIAEPN